MAERSKFSRSSLSEPSDSQVYAGGEGRQSGYGSRPERTLTTQVQGLMGDSTDQYDEMSRDGLQYGDPGQVRFATGRRDAAPPKFPKIIPDGTVGSRRRMVQKP